MELNHIAHALIALLPFVLGFIWYRKSNPWIWWAYPEGSFTPRKIGLFGYLLLYFLSLSLVFVFMNLIIHQIGFYELFFTDIMKGSEQAKQTAETFLSEHGMKHRHFKHGLFHGVIDAFAMSLPFLAFYFVLERLTWKQAAVHFGYWFICSAGIGALVAQFV